MNWKNKINFAIIKPCPSAPVRCTPVNKFAEIASPVPNYASSVNK